MPISRPGRGPGGFSLLEIIVVLVLIGLAAGLMLPSFTRGFRGLELEATARDMITHMKQMRSRAIAEQSVFRVICANNGEGNTYQLTNAYEEELKRVALPEGARFVFSDDREQSSKISFYSNGRSSGSHFTIASDGGRKVEIEVDPITGFAAVVKPDTPEGSR